MFFIPISWEQAAVDFFTLLYLDYHYECGIVNVLYQEKLSKKTSTCVVSHLPLLCYNSLSQIITHYTGVKFLYLSTEIDTVGPECVCFDEFCSCWI